MDIRYVFKETKDDGLLPFGMIQAGQMEKTEYQMIDFYEGVDDYIQYDNDFFEIADKVKSNINPQMRKGKQNEFEKTKNHTCARTRNVVMENRNGHKTYLRTTI